MIALPPGFDVNLFASDLISVALPFVSIYGLFLTFKLIKKSASRI